MIAPRNELLAGQEEKMSPNQVIRRALAVEAGNVAASELVVTKTIKVEDACGEKRPVEFLGSPSDSGQASPELLGDVDTLEARLRGEGPDPTWTMGTPFE